MQFTQGSNVVHDSAGTAKVVAVLENAYEIETAAGVRLVALPQELRTVTAPKARRPLIHRAGITVVRMAGNRISGITNPATEYRPLDPYSRHRRYIASGREIFE